MICVFDSLALFPEAIIHLLIRVNAFHQSQTVVETVKPKAPVTTLLEGLTDR